MKKMLLIMAVVALLIPVNALAGSSGPGVLDKENVMTDKSLAKYKSIGIKIFSTDNIEYNNVDDEEKQRDEGLPEGTGRRCSQGPVKNELNGDRVTAFIIDPDGKNAGKADMIIEGRVIADKHGKRIQQDGSGGWAPAGGGHREGQADRRQDRQGTRDSSSTKARPDSRAATNGRWWQTGLRPRATR